MTPNTMSMLTRVLLALALAALAQAAAAQQELPPNGLLLVAKPALTDPNFVRSVVLVTQATRLQHGGRDPQPARRSVRYRASRSGPAGR